MGYRASPCHTTILHQDSIVTFFEELKLDVSFMGKLQELYQPFGEYMSETDFVECFEAGNFRKALPIYMDLGCFELGGFRKAIETYIEDLEDLEDAIVRVEQFLTLLGEAEELSGLQFYLLWVGDEGDRYDDLSNEFAIEVGNVYTKTEPAQKYDKYLKDVSWVVYG